MLARLEGISAGSGVPLRSLCLINAMEAFLGSVRGARASLAGACSAVGVRGSWSVDVRPSWLHNFDYIPLVNLFTSFVKAGRGMAFRSLEFAVAAQAGVIDGRLMKRGSVSRLITRSRSMKGARLPWSQWRSPTRWRTARVRRKLPTVFGSNHVGAAACLLIVWVAGRCLRRLLSVELSNTRTAVRSSSARPGLAGVHQRLPVRRTQGVQVPAADVLAIVVPGPVARATGPGLACPARVPPRRTGPQERLARRNELAAIMADHGPPRPVMATRPVCIPSTGLPPRPCNGSGATPFACRLQHRLRCEVRGIRLVTHEAMYLPLFRSDLKSAVRPKPRAPKHFPLI